MKQFTLFKADNKVYELIIDVFKMLVGNSISYERVDECLLVIHNSFNEEEIKATFHSLEGDLNTNICMYVSYAGEEDFLKKELSLIKANFLKKEFGSYNLKSLLLSCNDIDNSNEILHFIVDGTGVDEVIIEKMAEADLNVSKASKLLYLHRNSLNYKIERLLEMRKFDLRKFKDCYVLYRLI